MINITNEDLELIDVTKITNEGTDPTYVLSFEHKTDPSIFLIRMTVTIDKATSMNLVDPDTQEVTWVYPRN